MKERVVLFICKGNSGRSQMAQAFFNHYSNGWKAMSAGTRPDERIHPWTVEVMKEIGIDVKGQKPKPLTNEMLENTDGIVLWILKLQKAYLQSILQNLRTGRYVSF